MSSHAFELFHQSPSEVEVIHKVEGHRYRFGIVKNAQGKRILSDTVETTSKEGAAHRAEFFSGSARAYAVSEAHRKHAID